MPRLRAGSAPRRPAAAAAFTLIELLVVLALVGLIAAAAAIGVGGLRRAKLQDQAFKLSRMSRSALIWALSRATTVRMVLDLDQFTVSVEEADSRALVDEVGRMVEPDAGEDDGGTGLGEAGPGGEPLAGERAGMGPAGETLPPGAEGPTGEEGAGEGLGGLFGGGMGLGSLFGDTSALEDLQRPPKYRAPAFTPINDPRFPTFTLEDVKTMRVYLPGAVEPITEGRAYVFYRDDGTADEAVIHIEDASGRVYAVAIQALTGRGAIYPYPFVPEELEVLP